MKTGEKLQRLFQKTELRKKLGPVDMSFCSGFIWHPVAGIEKTNNNTNKNNLFFIESTSFFSDRIIIPKNNNIKFLFNSLFFDNFII